MKYKNLTRRVWVGQGVFLLSVCSPGKNDCYPGLVVFPFHSCPWKKVPSPEDQYLMWHAQSRGEGLVMFYTHTFCLFLIFLTNTILRFNNCLKTFFIKWYLQIIFFSISWSEFVSVLSIWQPNLFLYNPLRLFIFLWFFFLTIFLLSILMVININH